MAILIQDTTPLIDIITKVVGLPEHGDYISKPHQIHHNNNHQYKEEMMDLQLIFTAILDGTSEISWTKLISTATTLPLFMASCLNQTNNEFKNFLDKYCKDCGIDQ